MAIQNACDADFDPREGGVRPVKLDLCDNHDYLTFQSTCSCNVVHHYVRFGVVGTEYGWLHNTAGDKKLSPNLRTAQRWANKYRRSHRGTL